MAFCLRFLLVAALSITILPFSASAETAPKTVLFVGGYGSSLATVSDAFAPLRAAFTASAPDTQFAQYSYTGWNAQTCAPRAYQSADTGQDFETSKRLLLETIYLLHTRCGAERIVVVGHSLGGLIAFQALADNPMSEVSEVVTIDSPLGGVPASEVRLCVETGLCASGPITKVLSDLYINWDATTQENTARVSSLAAAGIRVTAWGNEGDCLYAPSLCVPRGTFQLSAADVRDTQWLGIDRAMHRDYTPPTASLASVLNSHQAVISSAAPDIAADVLA
jgi:pimeloyl-ACP methyl ester carboxylesterase